MVKKNITMEYLREKKRELIKAESGWKIVEVGPRIGGYRNDMLDLSYNIKHMENYLLLKLEKKPIK